MQCPVGHKPYANECPKTRADLVRSVKKKRIYYHHYRRDIILDNTPDSMTTLAQRWHSIAPLAYGYPLGVYVGPTLGQSAINFMNFIYVSEIVLMLAQYWQNYVLSLENKQNYFISI